VTKNYELDLRDLIDCQHRPETPITDGAGQIVYWLCRCGRQHPIPPSFPPKQEELGSWTEDVGRFEDKCDLWVSSPNSTDNSGRSAESESDRHNDSSKALHVALSRLNELRELRDNWDEENAPAPSAAALTSARSVIEWAAKEYIKIADIDGDVLGGVAIWLEGQLNRKVWASCKNNGKDSIVLLEGNEIGHVAWNAEGKLEILAFLSGRNESTG
jgi:hypothetical protein